MCAGSVTLMTRHLLVTNDVITEAYFPYNASYKTWGYLDYMTLQFEEPRLFHWIIVYTQYISKKKYDISLRRYICRILEVIFA